MIASISPSTLKQYDKPLRSWWNFCQERKLNLYHPSNKYVLEFLAQVFETANSYGTVNTYRSAISLITTSNVGQDADIKRFFKGVSVLKPQCPKYEFTWDPSLVLSHLASFFPNESIPLENLTKKLVTLLALITAQRVQTLSKIKLGNIIFGNEIVQILIMDRIKTSAINRPQPVLKIPIFREKESLCVYSTLKTYLNRTNNLRRDIDDYLFITIKKPYRQASKESIGRWIKNTLSDSGIDTQIFSAHSVRHSSTSYAKRNGVNIEIIRKTAGWSENSRVFARFYDRPVLEQSDFANTILNCELRNH